MLKYTDYYNAGSKLLQYTQRPFFCDLKPDFEEIEAAAQEYSGYQNLIIIGNGGAVNSFLVLYRALYKGDVHVELINSMEPDLINAVRSRNPKDSTLAIVASTSGTNVGALEIMSRFMDYPMVVITADNEGALRQIAKAKALRTLSVPHITDRFLTSGACAYFPLALLGLDIRKIDSQLHEAYDRYSEPGNDALSFANSLFELEKKGYTDVFTPVYGSRLEAFGICIMQLMHESSAKDGKGQTFLVVQAPESQHHTNQRLFGGPKNMAGLFITCGQEDTESLTGFEEDLGNIALRNGTVRDISGIPLHESFSFECQGTLRDARDSGIPCGLLELDSAGNAAELVAFWHYAAVYSCWLRDSNPFDQPQVEKSKEIAFGMRKGFNQ